MKKICFVTTISGTITAFLTDSAQYLVEKHGYDVTFICDNDEAMYDYCSDKIHYIPVSMSRGVNLDFFKVTWQLRKIFKREKFDIIQYSTPNAALYASIGSMLAGVKNRLYCQWGIRYMGYASGVKRWLFKAIEKTTCACSSVIECESFSLRQFSLSEGLYDEAKCSVIGQGSACGVNISRYDITHKQRYRTEKRAELGIPEDAFVFGYTGRITRDKGLNELFAAFRKLNVPNAYLLIIGDFDNEGSLDTQLKEWALQEKNVIFAGRKIHVEQYYCTLDVFVSLSYREGFGLVVIEAAAMGVPAIVSNVPGQLDTIVDGKTGKLVKVKDVDEVVAAMTYMMNHPQQVLEMGVNARKNVEDNYDQAILFEELASHKDFIINH